MKTEVQTIFSPEEKQRRRDAVDEVVCSARLQGHTLSERWLTQAVRYIDEEISEKEFLSIVLSWHRRAG